MKRQLSSTKVKETAFDPVFSLVKITLINEFFCVKFGNHAVEIMRYVTLIKESNVFHDSVVGFSRDTTHLTIRFFMN